MKLSEAIRKGSEDTVQCKSTLVGRDTDTNEIIIACALGASIFAVLGHSEDVEGADLYSLFPESNQYLQDVPEELLPDELKNTQEDHMFSLESKCSRSKLSAAIIHLNDLCDWSREAIAEWVETIENYFESQQQETVSEETRQEVAVTV